MQTYSHVLSVAPSAAAFVCYWCTLDTVMVRFNSVEEKIDGAKDELNKKFDERFNEMNKKFDKIMEILAAQSNNTATRRCRKSQVNTLYSLV